MRLISFGNTGLRVSTLGFGCMRLPVIDGDNSRIDEEQAMEMVHYAIDHGINYFDTAYPYHGYDFSRGGASEPFLALALKNGYREKVYIATKLPSWLVETRKDMDRFLNEQLERLDTSRIDFYLLHSLDRNSWKRLLELGVLDFLDRARAAGKISYAGFSFHDQTEIFKEIVDAYPWTFCQIQYNYLDEDYQAGKEGLLYAAEKGLAVIAMEPLRGGTLVNGLPKPARELMKLSAPERTEAGWALHWLWKQPGLTMVLSGMSHPDHVKENIKLAGETVQQPWTEADEYTLKRVLGIIRGRQMVDCTACSYCMPCPEGVNIPQNFALFNDFHMLQDPAAKHRYQRLLSETARASNCIQCGLCEPQCPQNIPIRAELKHVDELLRS